MKKDSQTKDQAGNTYVFYAAETLEIVGESDKVKDFLEEYLKEELKSYSGIYRTNQVKDGKQALSAYRGLIMRVKGKEDEVPFPSEEVRTSASSRRDNEWDVYDAFTHEIVERTKDIRDFCTKHDLGKNAHVQIYKTNHYDEENKKHLLPSYKGYFIRKAETADKLVPFPEKKSVPPESYDVYEYSTMKLMGNYKDLKVFMKEKGLNPALETHLRKTGKPDREDPSKPMANQYRGYFVRQVGNNIELPFPGEPEHPAKGTGNVWCIFDKNLNIVEKTNDLQAFAQEKGLKHYKPFYDTNRVRATKGDGETDATIMRFYKGYLIRSEEDLKNWTHLPLPNPKNATDPDTSSLDLMVWKENGDALQGRYIPSYQKTFGVDTLDKEMLYELANKFLSNPEARQDGYGAVFIKDMKPGNTKSDDTMEALAELEVILPKEVIDFLS